MQPRTVAWLWAAASEIQSHTGRGVSGAVDGRKSPDRKRRVARGERDSGQRLAQKAEELRRDGQTVIFVAVDGRLKGLLGIADPIKPSPLRLCAILKPKDCVW